MMGKGGSIANPGSDDARLNKLAKMTRSSSLVLSGGLSTLDLSTSLSTSLPLILAGWHPLAHGVFPTSALESRWRPQPRD